MENEPQKERTLDEIEGLLKELVELLQPAPSNQVARGRPRIIPALCLWAGVLVCVLRGWNSQLAVWRLLAKRGLWSYPRFAISDQAVYKRLEQGGAEPLQKLFEQVSQVLQERLRPYAQPLTRFASQVVAIDETTLDKVKRHLPLLRAVPNGDDQLLPGKLAGIFDVRLQQWQKISYIENAHENEKVAAYDLLKELTVGALLLMDLGYFSFAWFDHLTDQGFYWISRLREKTSYQILHTFYGSGETFDGLIWLGAHRADRAAHAVRLVTFRVGATSYRYITNVTRPEWLSLHEIAVLYARRWDIEMAFKLIKRELNLHLFWSAKQVVIQQQVWAVLTIAQILHGLQMEIAGKAGVDPFDVSLPLLVQYLPGWNDVDFIALVVEQRWDSGFIRPSRRIRIQSPPIALEEYAPLPEQLSTVRTPRYARRRCPKPQN